MATEIVEKVIMEEFTIEENRNPEIADGEAKSLDNVPVERRIESAVLIEIINRIRAGDSNALEILIAAKERVKYELPIYAKTLKLTLLALKPFYLIALISLMNQSPANV